jgi:hypothetical protein
VKKFSAAVLLLTVFTLLMSSCGEEVTVERNTDKTETSALTASETTKTTGAVADTTAAVTAAVDTAAAVTAAAGTTEADITAVGTTTTVDINKLTPAQSAILDTYNDYIEQVAELAPAEAEILETFDSVMSGGYLNDTVLASVVINELIPETQEYIENIRLIDITDDELKSLNETYVKGWEKQLEAFYAIYEALIAQNKDLIEDANVLLAEGNKIITDFLDAIGTYVEKHNIITQPGGQPAG